MVVASLTYAAIHDENSSVRGNYCSDLLHLLEKRCLLLVSTRGIDDNDLKLLLLEEVDTLFSDLDRVSLLLVAEEGTLDLGGIHLELLESTSSESVCADETYAPALFHVMICEFGTSCCFTRSLQTDEHDNVGLALLELIGLVLALKHHRKLLDHSLLDEFAHVQTIALARIEVK